MLRSLLEQVRVAIHPRGIDAVVMRRLDGKILRRQSMEVELDAADEGWQKPLSRLPEVLAAVGAGGLETRIVLSNTLARFIVMPWQDALGGEDDWQAFARHALSEIYGERVATWQIRLVMQGYGQPVLACGVVAELVEGLELALREAGSRSGGILPFFSAAYDRFSRQPGKRAFWLVQYEPGCLCLARTEDGVVMHVTSRRTDADSGEALGLLIAREIERSGLAEESPAIYLHVAGGTSPVTVRLPDGTLVPRLEQRYDDQAGLAFLPMVIC